MGIEKELENTESHHQKQVALYQAVAGIPQLRPKMFLLLNYHLFAADPGSRAATPGGGSQSPGVAQAEPQQGAGGAAAGIHQLGLRMFFRWLQGSLPFFIVLLGKVFYDHRLGKSSCCCYTFLSLPVPIAETNRHALL